MFNVKNCTLKAKGLDLGAEPPILCRVHPRSLAPLGGPYLDKYALYHRHMVTKTSAVNSTEIIRETPDFELYLPVSRLESDISRIIAKVAISCRLPGVSIKIDVASRFEKCNRLYQKNAFTPLLLEGTRD